MLAPAERLENMHKPLQLTASPKKAQFVSRLFSLHTPRNSLLYYPILFDDISDRRLMRRILFAAVHFGSNRSLLLRERIALIRRKQIYRSAYMSLRRAQVAQAFSSRSQGLRNGRAFLVA
jgi:hypothetical protein